MRRVLPLALCLLASTLSAQTPITVTSPDGQPVKVAAPASVAVPCTLPADSIFPVGTTEVPCPGTSYPVTVTAPPPSRFDLTRDLEYLGAAKGPALPPYTRNGTGMAWNAKRGSVFIVCRRNDALNPPPEKGVPSGQKVSEILLPEPVNSANLKDLKTATILQPCTEPTEGKFKEALVSGTPTMIGGLIVWGDKLCGTLFSFYDGNSQQALSHWCRPLDLSVTGQVEGPWKLTVPPTGITNGTRVVNGYLAPVPTDLQALLGGPVITGTTPSAISGGASSGPTSAAWNPDQYTDPVVPHFYYPIDHPLGVWNQQSDLWNGTWGSAGAVFIRNTFLVFGSMGIGPFCYGTGEVCGDAVRTPRGDHAPPYVYRLHAFDPQAMRQQPPWAQRPYASWTFELPYAITMEVAGKPPDHLVNGVTVDPGSNRLILEQPRVNGDYSVFHLWQIKGTP
jgi:hypothetical protein